MCVVETLAEIPALQRAFSRRLLIVINIARRDSRALARFMRDGAFIERVAFRGRAGPSRIFRTNGALPSVVMAPRAVEITRGARDALALDQFLVRGVDRADHGRGDIPIPSLVFALPSCR